MLSKRSGFLPWSLRLSASCAALCVTTAQVSTTVWAAQAPDTARAAWRVSEDGTEVIDVHAKQAWSRCAEGMVWQGKTCTGEPLLLTHKEALAQAASRAKADGLRWRLPRVTDLKHLARDLSALPDAGDTLFPAAPREWFWAGTARVDASVESVNQYRYGNIMQGRTSADTNRMGFLHGWAVNIDTGEAKGDVLKRSKLPVRLVRTPD